jgi:two-component system response regulator
MPNTFPSAKSCRVLFIGADPARRELFTKTFQAAPNLEPQCSLNGSEALSLLRSQDRYIGINLIVLDWHLPDISALDVLRELKNDQVLRMIPVIVLVDELTPEAVADAYGCYANSVIEVSKDLNKLNALLSAIGEFWANNVQLPYCRVAGAAANRV